MSIEMVKHDWKDLVGRRLLVVNREQYDAQPVEVRLLEVAPLGEYIKLLFTSGAELWAGVERFRILDELPPPPSAPKEGSDA